MESKEVKVDLSRLREIFPGVVHTGLTDRQMLITAAQHEVVLWIAANSKEDGPLELPEAQGA